MNQMITEVLGKRRDRAIAIVLGLKERECDKHLPPETRHKLRKVVLDQFNDLYDFAVDLLESLDQGGVQINELYLEKLDQLHDDVSGLRRVLEEA